jgi:pimeloyl-ACP methyl ester carboxylesterase
MVVVPLVLSLAVLGAARPAAAQAPTPPSMPAEGPGGYAYPHAGVLVNGPYWAEGYSPNNNYRYFILEPTAPKPEAAPVVLFLHGYFARNLKTYDFWMRHMAQKGYVVVWVQYDVGTTLPTAYLSHVMVTWQDALKRLENAPFENHVRPERDPSGEPKTALVGHSVGALLAMGVAATANDEDSFLYLLPRPHALVLIEPGGWHILPTPAMHKIRPETRMLCLVADEDETVCKETGVNIWNRTSQIPEANKDFLLLLSDDHGQPEQTANHNFPNTTGFDDTDAIDGRDFYVTYRLSVAALNCVFRDMDCPHAFGKGSEEQLYMGEWSDGTERIPLVWVEDPATLETTCTDIPVPAWSAADAQASALEGTPGPGKISWYVNSLVTLLVPALLLAALRRRRRRSHQLVWRSSIRATSRPPRSVMARKLRENQGTPKRYNNPATEAPKKEPKKMNIV